MPRRACLLIVLTLLASSAFGQEVKLAPEVDPDVLKAIGVDSQRTVIADVVALDQVLYWNRLGAKLNGGMIFALRRDVVSKHTLMDAHGNDVAPEKPLPLCHGKVRLRSGKRPRPIVLRVAQGDRLVIRFQNLLGTAGAGASRIAGMHCMGLELMPTETPDGKPAPGIGSDGSWVGANPGGTGSLVAPGGKIVYSYYAKKEGSFLLYSQDDKLANQLASGLFGAVNVLPAGAEAYRSQVTRVDLSAAAYHRDRLPANMKLERKFNVVNGQTVLARTPSGKLLWTLRTRVLGSATARHTTVVLENGHIYAYAAEPFGVGEQPVLDYQATFKTGRFAGSHILKMHQRIGNTDQWELLYSDLTGIITGPGADRFPYSNTSASFFQNPAYPDRRQPYREFTIHYHNNFAATQAFPQYENKKLSTTVEPGADRFGINYGIGGIGSEILANRLGVGPMGNPDAVDLKYEEFFLSSWAVGDPAMVVDNPANLPGKATKTFHPDDPSNVYHSYMRDHVRFQILNANTAVTHIHHQHAHQWLHSPNNDRGHYLDSQTITSGSSYTLDMVYNGSGNRNQTVGDSIFHCHFYPHLAQGMWALWRVHDVFERGTKLDADGRPLVGLDGNGRRIWNRALPDGEIETGTPIPAIVPMPSIAMATVPAKVAVVGGGRRIIVESTKPRRHENPGYPFFIPGIAGNRAPHPPLDFAWEETSVGVAKLNEKGRKIYLDGGLPRHLVTNGTIVRELHTRWDFSKDFILYDSEDKTDKNRKPVAGGLVAIELPEEGTPVEKAAMRAHATRTHPSFLPNGDPGNFILNGLPPVPGAPYADPGVSDYGNSVINTRRYQAAVVQMDVVFNKKGWHYPQQRFITLWEDVAPTVSGERPPEPFFFRANTGETVEFWHTNLVPSYYEADDFQVRTPTDVLGQHIHLVKFDVLASDGAANGFNYEDGTFSPDEVRDRINAINLERGIYAFDSQSQFMSDKYPRQLVIKPSPKVFGSPPPYQNWDGAQTTIQRFDTDPLLNNRGEDRTLRTVFTHDHFSPSTHQQIGLYAAMLVEPEGSEWINPVNEEKYYDLSKRSDGGPTGWQAIILTVDKAESYREFMLEFQDFQLAYTATSRSTKGPLGAPGRSALFNTAVEHPPLPEAGSDSVPVPPWLKTEFRLAGITLSEEAVLAKTKPGWTISDAGGVDQSENKTHESSYDLVQTLDADVGLQIYTRTFSAGWADHGAAINPPQDENNVQNGPPYPQLISDFPLLGTYSLNYRNEPLPLRLDAALTEKDPGADQNAVDLAWAYASIMRHDRQLNHQPELGAPIDPSQRKGFRWPRNPLIPEGPHSVRDTDPYTPMLRAYEGDRVQVRTLVGAHVLPHTFTLHGLKWLFEPSAANSGWRSFQLNSLSEHFELIFELPPATTTDANPFADYLYSVAAGVTGQTNGAWGLLRSYRARVPDLAPLPANPRTSPAPAFEWPKKGKPPEGDVTIRRYDITVTTAAKALPRGTLVYNDRGQAISAQPMKFDGKAIQNPDALIYVRTDDLVPELDENSKPNAKAGALKDGVPIEPLVIRAAAGEWIEITLRNTLPKEGGKFFTTPQGAANHFPNIGPFSGSGDFASALDQKDFPPGLARLFKKKMHPLKEPVKVLVLTQGVRWTVTGESGVTYTVNQDRRPGPAHHRAPKQVVVYRNITFKPTRHAGLHPQLVALDVSTSDGMNVGFNPVNTVPPGGVNTFYWYAGSLEFSAEGQLKRAVPVEFGAVNLMPCEPLVSHQQGLIGALIIEPEGSQWCVDENSRASATVRMADGSAFREFVVVMQVDPATSSSGAPVPPAGFNYRTEPLAYRLPPTEKYPVNVSAALSNALVQADPQTPVFVAGRETPVRVRWLFPGGDGDEAITVHGHVWQEEPFSPDSSRLEFNPMSQTMGSFQYGVDTSWNMLLDRAGGTFGVTGDYLYHAFVGEGPGLWGVIRVAQEGKDAVVINTAGKDSEGRFVIRGVNTVNPETGKYADYVTLFAVPPDAPRGSLGQVLGKAPVKRPSRPDDGSDNGKKATKNRNAWGTWSLTLRKALPLGTRVIAEASVQHVGKKGKKVIVGGRAEVLVPFPSALPK